MNCFEARNDFVGFWQKALSSDRRAEMLAHLQQCAGCDHSFRSFALTAPVLYSASEPRWTSEVAQPISRRSVEFEFPGEARVVERRSLASRWNRLLPALVMAAAAV